MVQATAGGYCEYDHYNAPSKPPTRHRSHHDSVELMNVLRRHFSREPSAQGEADYVHRREILLARESRIKRPKVAHVHNPVDVGRFSKAWMLRDPEGALGGERGMPCEPAG